MRIGVTPFFNRNKSLLLRKICSSKVIFPEKEKYGLEYSDDFVDIVNKLLEKDKNTRLGSAKDVHEVLSHPWFADIDVRKINDQQIEPPLKPDMKEGQLDFKYFNLKQQTDVNTFIPLEKVNKVKENQPKFADFDGTSAANNQ